MIKFSLLLLEVNSYFDSQVVCPPYANSACFKSVSEHVEGSKISVEVVRGCSTFSMQDAGQEDNKAYCNGFRLNDVQYEVCKQTCTDKDNCNNKEPDVFGEPLKCFTCSETWNHLNQSIGYSDTGKNFIVIPSIKNINCPIALL